MQAIQDHFAHIVIAAILVCVILYILYKMTTKEGFPSFRQLLDGLKKKQGFTSLTQMIESARSKMNNLLQKKQGFKHLSDASDRFQDYGVVAAEKDAGLVEGFEDTEQPAMVIKDSVLKTDELSGAFPGPADEESVPAILKNQNFLEAADIVGSVREPLRNSVIDLRGAPVIPKQVLSPWNNSTSATTHTMGLTSNLF